MASFPATEIPALPIYSSVGVRVFPASRVPTYQDGYADGYAASYASGYAAGEAAHASDYADGRASAATGPTVSVTSPAIGSSVTNETIALLVVAKPGATVATIDSVSIDMDNGFQAEIYDGAIWHAAFSGSSVVGTAINIVRSTDWDATVNFVSVTATDSDGDSASRTIGSWTVTPISTSDVIPPTVSVISPTPGVAPGQPGGFPANRRAAERTPIVLEVTEANLTYACVIAEFPVIGKEVVFRRGGFASGYRSSTFQMVGDVLTLTVVRDRGWPRHTNPALGNYIKFSVDVVDSGGNLT